MLPILFIPLGVVVLQLCIALSSCRMGWLFTHIVFFGALQAEMVEFDDG